MEEQGLLGFHKAKCSMQKSLCLHEGGWNTGIRDLNGSKLKSKLILNLREMHLYSAHRALRWAVLL